jgi:quercetin dioxygenase-like cupin family protein
MRIVEYSAGYLADHWCAKGHVVYVLEGELITELQNGDVHRIPAGQGYYVGDDVMPHRSRTEAPVRMLIVD